MPRASSQLHRAHRVNTRVLAVWGGSLLAACAAGRVDSQPATESPADASSSMPVVDGSTPEPMPEAATPGDEPDASSPVSTGDAASPAPDTGGADMPEASAPEAMPTTEASTSDAPATLSCVPATNTDTLPFAVDVAGKYITSGYEGDIPAITMPVDPTCSGNRSSATAMGNCHPVIYTPPPPGSTAPTWAGVLWQHPVNNWGNLGAGYAIPPGATKVSFWARGQSGGEVVTFLAGFAVSPTAAAPCVDTASGSLRQALTSSWTHYTIPLTGTYGPGVVSAFGYTVGAADQPVRDAGAGDGGAPSTVFFIDDIEWQP